MVVERLKDALTTVRQKVSKGYELARQLGARICETVIQGIDTAVVWYGRLAVAAFIVAILLVVSGAFLVNDYVVVADTSQTYLDLHAEYKEYVLYGCLHISNSADGLLQATPVNQIVPTEEECRDRASTEYYVGAKATAQVDDSASSQ